MLKVIKWLFKPLPPPPKQVEFFIIGVLFWTHVFLDLIKSTFWLLSLESLLPPKYISLIDEIKDNICTCAAAIQIGCSNPSSLPPTPTPTPTQACIVFQHWCSILDTCFCHIDEVKVTHFVCCPWNHF